MMKIMFVSLMVNMTCNVFIVFSVIGICIYFDTIDAV